MTAPRSGISPNVLVKQLQTAIDPKQRAILEEKLWQSVAAAGSPLCRLQENGQYQVTFLHRSSSAREVELACPDLYDRMLDETGEPRKFQRIPGTDTFIMQFDNIPADAFCPYHLVIDGDKEHPIQDTNNHKSFSAHHVDVETAKTDSQVTSYIPLPLLEPHKVISGPLSGSLEAKETLHDSANTFADRSAWVYKSKNFDPATGNVIFMLDGEHICKTLTPYIDILSSNKDNIFSNVAIVFVNPDLSIGPPPGRVNEYYMQRDAFSKYLAEQVIPKYCGTPTQPGQLGNVNGDRVILAAHSLAAYPVIDIVRKYTDQVGGAILLSPALNQKLDVGLPETPSNRLACLPIYTQVGKLEDAKPPVVHQEPREMQNKSRLEAVREFHQSLVAHGYNTEERLNVFSSGHSEVHTIEGMAAGLRYVQDHSMQKSLAEHTERSRRSKECEAFSNMKSGTGMNDTATPHLQSSNATASRSTVKDTTKKNDNREPTPYRSRR